MCTPQTNYWHLPGFLLQFMTTAKSHIYHLSIYLSRHVRQQTGEHFLQRLSMAIQKGNCICLNFRGHSRLTYFHFEQLVVSCVQCITKASHRT